MGFRQKIFPAVLMVFALFNGLKWVFHFSTTPYQPIDFRTYYLGANSFLHGTNPYPDSAQANAWKTYAKNENQWTKATGFPHAVTVYAPQFVWFFSIYNILDFTASKWLQFFLNLCALGLIIFCIKKLQPDLPYAMIIAGIFSFRGTWYALDTGQPMIQVLALCVLSIYWLEKTSFSVLPAFVLAFVSFKFTLLIPVVIYLLCTKRKSVFMNYVLLVMILNTAVLIITPYPSDMFQAWKGNINALSQYTHSHGILNGLNVISSSISVALYYFFLLPVDLVRGISTLLLLCGYGISIYIGLRQSPKAAIIFACLTGLCFGHHLVYDLLALIVFLFILKDPGTVKHIICLLLGLVMALPLGSIGAMLHIPWLDFVVPFLLLTYWCFLLYYYLLSRNRVIKNPS